MQEPGRRTTRPFAGVDLRRPKGYPASTPAKAEATAPVEAAAAGDPCPRCESQDTKFCYYNNYNTSQPRHFCKSCRRYWTKGGSLRNSGGGSSRKSHSSSAAPKNPERSKNSKRRRAAPAPEPAPSTDASTAADADAAQTEAAKGTADDTAAPPAADGGFTDPSVALGLSLTDAGGKELSDPSPFEWPSGCELGSYWATGVFAGTDPELFLNLP